ncbi:MAG: hypothetical protein IKF68_00680 [Erysipelotrichaceae bacterium]|nr:hypothetical protein [Erysipelotrichaceae bacterium]
MNRTLTEKEKEFLSYLKKALRFSGISIRQKVNIEELCEERKDVPITFENEKKLVKDVVIDFVLYRKGKAIAGIEIVDEPEEYRSAKGEKILKDFVFRTLGYEYFRVIRMDKLRESADIIKEKISHL